MHAYLHAGRGSVQTHDSAPTRGHAGSPRLSDPSQTAVTPKSHSLQSIRSLSIQLISSSYNSIYPAMSLTAYLDGICGEPGPSTTAHREWEALLASIE